MNEITYKVDGMTCQHCVRAIKSALEPMEGVSAVFVDLPANEVRVVYDASKARVAEFQEKIEEEGYAVLTKE